MPTFEQIKDVPIGSELQIDQIRDTLGADTAIALLEMAATNVESLMVDLKQSVQNNDSESATKSLHSIKGSVSSLSAKRLTEISKELEAWCHDLSTIKEAMPLLVQVVSDTIVWWNAQLQRLRDAE